MSVSLQSINLKQMRQVLAVTGRAALALSLSQATHLKPDSVLLAFQNGSDTAMHSTDTLFKVTQHKFH